MSQNETPRIRAMVVDDERIACEGVKLLLSKDPDIKVVDTCTIGVDAIGRIRMYRPDLLFLDIQMPRVTGFDVLEALPPDERPITIFVTAYDQYALKAFEVNAIDYLLKPFDDARFYQTLEKAKLYYRQARSLELSEKLQSLIDHIHLSPPSVQQPPRYLTRLAIKNAGEIIFLKVKDIDWIEADDYYVSIQAGGKRYLQRETLNNLEKQLDPEQFIRVHRCTIVNIDRIKSVQPHFNNEYVVVTQQGKRFRISRSRKEALKNLLGI